VNPDSDLQLRAADGRQALHAFEHFACCDNTRVAALETGRNAASSPVQDRTAIAADRTVNTVQAAVYCMVGLIFAEASNEVISSDYVGNEHAQVFSIGHIIDLPWWLSGGKHTPHSGQ
jgi:hypothetical protein